METLFLEVVLDSAECSDLNIKSRDEVEDELEDIIEESGLGSVSGGGGGKGLYNIDIDLCDERTLDQALVVIRTCLISLNVPRSTRIIKHKPQRQEFPVYG